MLKLIRFFLFPLACWAASCQAELFYFPAVSPSTMGTCFASAPAGMEDITQQFFNPAVTAYFDDDQLAAVGSILFPRDNFDSANGLTFTGDEITGVSSPRNVSPHIGGGALYGCFVLTNKIRLGIAITTPWRKKTTYAYDWVGRYFGTRLDMIGFNITPTLSWSIHDTFYFGIGPQFQSMSFNFEEAIDFGSIAEELNISGAVPGGQDGFLNASGNNWGVGWAGGLIFKPCWYMRLGIGYRSEIKHSICASSHFELSEIGKKINQINGVYSTACSADVKVNSPGIVWAGLHYYHNACWEAMASISFRQWSGADNITVDFGGGDTDINAVVSNSGWRDNVSLSAGVKYYPPCREWYLRGGGMFQENPVTNSTQNPLLFGNANGSVSAGWGCCFWGCIFLDAAWLHTFPVEIGIDQTASQNGNVQRGDLTGKVRTQADIISFSIIAEY